jgi:tripartite-type tricarboxylate transporter receptor subunit TctC
VTTACVTAMVFVVGPMVPATVKTLADFIAWCKANPKQSTYGSPGAGSPLHFLGVMLSRAAKFEYLHVPFQGTAPSIQSLLGGQIASCISPIGPFIQHIRAGTLRALATTGATRSPELPDVPTIAEAGYPSLQYAEWFGFFVPAKTPGATVEKLSSALRAALQTKQVQAGLAAQSVDPGGLTPAEFARQIKVDYERWGPIVKASGFTPVD